MEPNEPSPSLLAKPEAYGYKRDAEAQDWEKRDAEPEAYGYKRDAEPEAYGYKRDADTEA
ncbi:hypothetical protein RhiirA4_473091 [Rhizophagus irregularis]|uniref:Uncharacterized protein n=1 Tax=Rhizophagus irregularis TaxID=588596 RepID=A0A2I1H628_9GLOM|nr:hypothetical protein RhiirA4_473091 [Rhizophagus irregularis]